MAKHNKNVYYLMRLQLTLQLEVDGSLLPPYHGPEKAWKANPVRGPLLTRQPLPDLRVS